MARNSWSHDLTAGDWAGAGPTADGGYARIRKFPGGLCEILSVETYVFQILRSLLVRSSSCRLGRLVQRSDDTGITCSMVDV